MNPLDLLKVKFQVSTRGPEGRIGRGIWLALRDIRVSEGWRGLYRGLGPNVAGNASSWGLYFLLCVAPFFFPLSPRRRANSEQLCLLFIATTNSNAARPSTRPTGPSRPPNICCILPKRVAQSFLFFFRTPEPLPLFVDSFFFFCFLFVYLGAVTAILTNPIWVVKVRTFTAAPNSPAAHRGLWSACAFSVWGPLFSLSKA